MLVYVINKDGKPLMPCSPRKARKLLEAKKAKVIRRTPFTIKLLYGSSGYRQPVIAGMDTGSKTIGCAATANNRVVYQAEIELRKDVSKKMTQRSMYRRNRRNRKTRYRKPRWDNRKSKKIAPSIKSKIDSHLREKKFVESILPVTKWHVETASFDIHKITNPAVSNIQYHKGPQKGFYNIKAYILHRDNYACKSSQKCKHNKKLQVHHIIPKSQGGSDAPDNLITLCVDCHVAVHANKFKIKSYRSKTKFATEIGIIKSQLKKVWKFKNVFGYETKYIREQILSLTKTHSNDAIAICCKDNSKSNIKLLDTIYLKRHVCSGDYQQTKGKRSEKKIPTGKLFGLRKFDLIQTIKGTGFVKGRMSTGYFVICNILWKTIITCVNVKKDCKRLAARKTTLIYKSSNSSPKLKI